MTPTKTELLEEIRRRIKGLKKSEVSEYELSQLNIYSLKDNCPVFAVITNDGGYKYITEIAENYEITRIIQNAMSRTSGGGFTSKVYDARVFSWTEEARKDANPDYSIDIANSIKSYNQALTDVLNTFKEL